MRKPTKPCLVGLLNVLLTLTVSVAVADELVGPPEPAPARTQADPLTANTAPTFWLGGKVTTAFDAGPSEARSVVAQADGKLVVGGGAGDSYVLSRYLADGRLDETFGVGGRVLTPILFGCGGWAYSLVQQADGKLLLAGEGCGRAAVIRYLADGGLDASFGDAGIASHNLVFGFDGRSVAVQADGKLLLAGAVISPSSWDFALVRLLNNGSLDPTFGSGGYVTTDLGGYNNEQANSVLLQPDGKIVATGRSNGGFAVARYLANGVPDSGFGTQGKTVAFEDSAHSWTTGGFASALEADGKLLVAGTTLWGGTRPGIAVVRFLADGSLDANFGAGGLAAFKFTGWSHDEARAILQQPDGRIVVAGYSGSDFALLRLLSDGTLDSGFGGNGKLLTDFGSSDQAFGLAQHADGRLIAVGSSYFNDTRFALARYHPDGGLDLSFGKPGDSLAWPRTLWEQSSDRLGPLARILDTELAAAGTYDGATLTLRRQGGANAEDEFSAMSGGSLSVLTPGSYFAIDSITIGRVLTNGGGTLQLRFMGANATQARVDKAMQQIDYTNTSDRPPAQVLIDWTFDDGNTGAQGTGGALSTTGTVTVNINSWNDRPQLVKSPPPQTAVANVAFSYTLPADTFNDPDGDPLTWNLSMADGTGLPPWLNFNPATRVLSGTPTEFDIGTLNLRIIVKDPANASAEAYMTLRVTAVTNTSGLNASILPTARSVQIGQPATAFGTLINATGLDAWNCYLAIPPDASIPATFTYQTTNDSNQLIGTVNTSIDISAGSAQNFVFGITPNAAFNATDIPIVFDCANTVPAPSQAGLNTFLLSASSTPAPDMVAIGATPSGDGVLHIPGSTGIHAFGASAVNIGATGTITATADTGGVSLPLTLTLCQTNPGTGGCLAPPAASVSSSIGNQQVATYAVFAQATGAIAFDPSANRIFLRLSSGGVVRGGTSVAVTTE